MEYENLWEEAENKNYKSTDGILEFLRAQGDYLYDWTNKKVNAKYRMINKYIRSGDFANAYENVFIDEYAIDNQKRQKKKDAAQLYMKSEYVYELTSLNYQFRMFYIIIPPYYPVEIQFDEGVYEDIKVELGLNGGFSQNYVARDFDWLKSAIGSVFASRKVQYILSKLKYNPSCGAACNENEDITEYESGEYDRLLALNASIEDERAGGDGRYFQIISEELNQLSEESIKGLEKIEEQIKLIERKLKILNKMENHEEMSLNEDINILNSIVADAKSKLRIGDNIA